MMPLSDLAATDWLLTGAVVTGFDSAGFDGFDSVAFAGFAAGVVVVFFVFFVLDSLDCCLFFILVSLLIFIFCGIT